jgi:hypothetical protein
MPGMIINLLTTNKDTEFVGLAGFGLDAGVW